MKRSIRRRFSPSSFQRWACLCSALSAHVAGFWSLKRLGRNGVSNTPRAIFCPLACPCFWLASSGSACACARSSDDASGRRHTFGMPAAPLPQPAPFTCSHCGASLNEQPEFCPRCGAPLTPQTRPSLSRLAIVGLAFGLLLFGSVGACSAVLTVMSLSTLSDPYSRLGLIFVIPSLLICGVSFFLCARALFRRGR